MEDKVKEAFQKVRLDIDFLYQEIQDIKRTLSEIKGQIQHISTFQQTLNRHSTDTPAHQHIPKALKSQDLDISTGNVGVPADRQTDNNPPISHGKFAQNSQNLTQINEENLKKSQKIDKIANIGHISTLLSSLDELKKEVRFKFKKLTTQEMLVFSKIYELENQGLIVDYTILAEKLSLTESSIRDYIQRLIKKGIPVDKLKENNKKIILSISKQLKKIVSLETIYQLRAI